MKANEFLKKNWYWIAGAIVVILVVWYIYRQGKKKGSLTAPKIIDLPTDVAGQPLSEEEAREVREISGLLYDDLSGGTTGRNEVAYRRFAALGDKLFAAVYEDFNRQHFDKGDGTLKQWIEDDYFLIWSEEKNLVDNQILPRMARLNLV